MDTLASGLSQRFIARIESRQAVIGLVGLGYAGLPLVLACEEAGFSCIGFDIDPAKIDKLCDEPRPISTISRTQRIAALNASGRFSARPPTSPASQRPTSWSSACRRRSRGIGEPDMTYVVATAEAIAPHLKPGQLVSLESTTYPTTSEGLLDLGPGTARAIFAPGTGPGPVLLA